MEDREEKGRETEEIARLHKHLDLIKKHILCSMFSQKRVHQVYTAKLVLSSHPQPVPSLTALLSR